MTEQEKQQSEQQEEMEAKVRAKVDRLAELAAQQEDIKREADAIKGLVRDTCHGRPEWTPRRRPSEYWGEQERKGHGRA